VPEAGCRDGRTDARWWPEEVHKSRCVPGGGDVYAVRVVRDNERLLTAAEVAERLGFTERYVWRLGREGVLPRIKLPGRKYVRFAEEDVAQFIAGARRRPAAGRSRLAAPSRPVPRRF
jgi:excisionase family DNA binding protein